MSVFTRVTLNLERVYSKREQGPNINVAPRRRRGKDTRRKKEEKKEERRKDLKADSEVRRRP